MSASVTQQPIIIYLASLTVFNFYHWVEYYKHLVQREHVCTNLRGLNSLQGHGQYTQYQYLESSLNISSP